MCFLEWETFWKIIQLGSEFSEYSTASESILPSTLGNEPFLTERSVSSWCSLKKNPCSGHVGTLIHTPWITWAQMQVMPETACWGMLTKTPPFSLSQRLWQQIYFPTNAETTSARTKWSFQKSGFLLKQYLNKKNLFKIAGLKLGNSGKNSDELSFSREGRKTVANSNFSHFSPVDPTEIPHIITLLLRSPNGVDKSIWAGEWGKTNFADKLKTNWAESSKFLRNQEGFFNHYFYINKCKTITLCNLYNATLAEIWQEVALKDSP